MPPACAVESHVPCYLVQGYAVSTKREPPRAKPVASKKMSADLFHSNHRDTPPDKPVASLRVFTQSREWVGENAMTVETRERYHRTESR